MLWQIVFGQAVGEYEDGRVLVEFSDLADREPSPGPVIRDERVLVFVARIEPGDRLFVQAALKDPEARRPRAALVFARDPGQFLELIGADTAPEARALGSISGSAVLAPQSAHRQWWRENVQ